MPMWLRCYKSVFGRVRKACDHNLRQQNQFCCLHKYQFKTLRGSVCSAITGMSVSGPQNAENTYDHALRPTADDITTKLPKRKAFSAPLTPTMKERGIHFQPRVVRHLDKGSLMSHRGEDAERPPTRPLRQQKIRPRTKMLCNTRRRASITVCCTHEVLGGGKYALRRDILLCR